MHSDHVVPTRIYYTIFAILMAGTALTVAVASVDVGAAVLGIAPARIYAYPTLVSLIGGLNVIVALAIAVLKATLVVLFFMHVRYSTRLTWAVVASAVFWLGILLALTFGDYLTRSWRTYG